MSAKGQMRHLFMSFTRVKREKRVRGIEPPCAAWEAAVLPLNYTREEIFDFRFAIADCNRNKFEFQIAVGCAVLSASSRRRMPEAAGTADATSLPRDHVVRTAVIRTGGTLGTLGLI